jgi:Protein of unknown function (DUF2612)
MSSIDPDSGATIPENGSAPFPNPCDTTQNYDAQAQGEVLHQYRESTKLKATITALMSAWQAIEDCAVNISRQRDPAVAAGVNLDVTGDLVGQSRVLTTGTVLLDADYRLIVGVRIARNHSIGSSPEFLDFLVFVFGATPFRYMDFGGMAVGIEVGTGTAPAADIVALLDHGPAPRAMAVGVGREWYDPADYFAFNTDPGAGAKGFAIASDPTAGGKFAMTF